MNLTALKIAAREAKASAGKFLFVVLAVAAGVGALTGVRGFSEAFRGMLLRQARALMAADVSVRIYGEASEEQKRAIEALRSRKVEFTPVTETLSMVSSDAVPDPLLGTLKAVDARVFPFYGTLTLEPAGKLADRLNAETVVISEDLRLRLKAEPGTTLRIGGQPFRVAGVVTAEPDRMSGSFSVGPRLMLSREGLDRTGLLRLGSRASQRMLFRMGTGAPPIGAVTEELKKAFPESMVVDYRETNPNIARGLDRATTFLSLVSLIALIVGSIGVATAMHGHLQSKLDTIAVMKSIGGRSGQIVRIYLIQTAMLGLAGGILGVVVGALIQSVFPVFVQRYFQVQAESGFSISSALQGLLLGLLTSLLFTLPPLLGIRSIRPSAIFRRDMAEAKLPWRQRFAEQRLPALAGLIICVALAGIGAWLIGGAWKDALRFGGYFVGGLLVSLVLLAAVATLLLSTLRWVVRVARLPVTVRHALSNLYRPGSQSHAVLTALGVGVMFTLTVYLIQRSVLQEISRSAPPGMANVFFLDVTAEQKDELAALIRKHPGVEQEPDVIPTVSARITAIDGVPIDQVALPAPMARRMRMARAINPVAKQPDGTVAVQGVFWKSQPVSPEISIAEGTARALKLKVGSTIQWNSFGREITSRVAVIHRTDMQRLRANLEFLMSPGVLDGLPTVYYGAARVKSASIASLQRASYEKFPTVTVVNISDILDRVQEVVDQIAIVVRFISAFTIFAGAIILASSIAGSRFRRIREVVILKTLGATRGRIAAMFSMEFLVIGVVAGVMGSVLATAFSALVLKRFFDSPFHFQWMPNLLSVLATAGAASAAGWLASFRLLGQKPLEILRGE